MSWFCKSHVFLRPEISFPRSQFLNEFHFKLNNQKKLKFQQSFTQRCYFAQTKGNTKSKKGDKWTQSNKTNNEKSNHSQMNWNDSSEKRKKGTKTELMYFNKDFLEGNESDSQTLEKLNTSKDPIIDWDSERLMALFSLPVQTSMVSKKTTLLEDELPSVKEFFLINRDEGDVNLYIRTLSVRGMFNEAKEAFNLYQKNGGICSVRIYTSLLTGCASIKNVEEAELIMKQMREAGIEPTLWTYNTLINVYVKSDKLDGAMEILKQIEDDNLLPDRITYSCLLQGCLLRRDFDRGFKLFDLVTSKGIIESDEVMYTIMISLCAQAGMTEKALNLFNEMKIRDLHPTEVTYNALLFACASRRDFYNQAFLTFEQMKGVGFIPTIETYGALMHACRINGDILRASQIVSEIESKMKPNQVIYNTYIYTLANAQRFDRNILPARDRNINDAEKVLERMKSKDVPIEIDTINALLSVYTHGANFLLAEKRMKEIFEDFPNIQPNKQTYSLMIGMLTSGGTTIRIRIPKAIATFDELKSKGFTPDSTDYEKIILGCTFALRLTDAIKYLREMVENNMKPNKENLKLFIATLSNNYRDLVPDIYKLCHWKTEKQQSFKPWGGLLEDKSYGETNKNSKLSTTGELAT